MMPMEKMIASEKVKQALQAKGWSQKALASELGVTGQAVTNWLKGIDFPRPDKLLKLAMVLQLGFSDLVQITGNTQPIIAFRKKGSAKTTDAHIQKAKAMGELLKTLVPHLPELPALRLQLPNPSTSYEALQTLVSQVRERLGLGAQAVLSYEHLLKEFEANGAVIIPTLWGEKLNHKNALHILLPNENVTFVYLNLDTRQEDFKFWMAHELAHVFTTEMAGTEVGEDFADAFAGALLFPKAQAQLAYEQLVTLNKTQQLAQLKQLAGNVGISLFSVFSEINSYAKAQGLSPLKHNNSEIHAVRNLKPGVLVSESLFKPVPPEPAAYMAAAENVFRSPFFASLKRYINQHRGGAGYLQQIMDIPMQDAHALHAELSR